MKLREWENVYACAYNAAVNSDTERGKRKMRDLIEAINYQLRVEGRAKLSYLREKGLIDDFDYCPPTCQMRPGGLFHVEGCTNEMNHPVYRERTRLAEAKLTGEEGGYWTASVSLVGAPA